MSRQIQLRRGTKEENDEFIGAPAEITIDLSSKTIRVHDGVTPGGTTLLNEIPNASISAEKLAGSPSFDGNAGKTIAVNALETGFEFITHDPIIDYKQNANNTWYIKFRSGRIIQGGKSIAGNTLEGETITLPTPFTTKTYIITNSTEIGGEEDFPNSSVTNIKLRCFTTTSFNAMGSYTGGNTTVLYNPTFFWMAVGF